MTPEKQISRIVDSAEMRRMVRALKALEKFGVKVEKTPTTRLLTIPNGRVAFRAMKGAARVRGTWLVTYDERLFVTR